MVADALTAGEPATAVPPRRPRVFTMSLNPLQIKQLFRAATSLPPGERETFLRSACSDEVIRQRVSELLACHATADRFLEPAAGPPGAYQPGDKVGHYTLRTVI